MLNSSPSGKSHTYTWDSVADNVAIDEVEDDVSIRITPSDSLGEGTPNETDSFTVDNYTWKKEVVHGIGDAGMYSSIALDTNNSPRISYFDPANDDLRYAYWDGFEWQTEAIDTVGSVGQYSSLALDSTDHPHISYWDYSNVSLKYAYHDGAEWQIETVDQSTITNVGQYCSLAVDSNNRPHISYFDSNDHLKYAYWDGSQWQIVVCAPLTGGFNLKSG